MSEATFKIGKVVPEPLVTCTKYQAIWERVSRLKHGQWLPIEFPDKSMAFGFRTVAITHRTIKMKAVLRGLIVYITRRTT